MTPEEVDALGVSTDLRTAARALNISGSAAYKLAADGEFRPTTNKKRTARWCNTGQPNNAERTCNEQPYNDLRRRTMIELAFSNIGLGFILAATILGGIGAIADLIRGARRDWESDDDVEALTVRDGRIVDSTPLGVLGRRDEVVE